MFKIESYITPLLMGYVDKYVKLRPEDFQLSLWGGDAVLYNLDLRLDVIEKIFQLPIVFQSGHIHELRLHIPWTKLGYEPVVVTINTIECILKLRDTAYSDRHSSRAGSEARSKVTSPKQKIRKQDGDDLPPGYLQSLMNKIMNNVSIIVNNLIIKFVEDDIVLSLNVKSAECYSVDKNWTRGFIELAAPDYVLRRVINFCDLTVCLDKRDASGKIEHYQDPIMYRCSVSSRLYSKYEGMNAKFPLETKWNVFCERFDLSVTDTQLPMFLRIIELALAIYYGTLEFQKPAPENDETPEKKDPNTEIDMSVGEPPTDDMDESKQGWVSWAWSYVPQILPEDEETNSQDSDPKPKKKRSLQSVVSIGMYAYKMSIIFKVTEFTKEKAHYGPKKISFKPFLFLESEGISMEILFQGLTFFDAQFGITNLRVFSQGVCICGAEGEENSRNNVLLAGGDPLMNKSTNNYIYQSLFDPQSPENLGIPKQQILEFEEHKQVYTEQYGLQKYGVFWMDYLYSMPRSEDDKTQSSRSSVSSLGEPTAVFEKENSLLRFVIGKCHLNISSTTVHRVRKVLDAAYRYEYESYSKKHEERVDENRPYPTEDQVKSLIDYIPTRTYHVTLLQPVISLLSAEHPHCDIAKKVYKSQQAGKKTVGSGSSQIYPLFGLQMSSQRFDLQVTSPMYPRKLIQLVSKIAGPPSNLLHHCHSHTQIKLFGAHIGLTKVDLEGNRSPMTTIMPPSSGAMYIRRLLLPMYWSNMYLPKLEKVYELPQVSVSLTKGTLLVVLDIISSWQQNNPKPADITTNTLLEDVFPNTESEKKCQQPVLEMTLYGMELKTCRNDVVTAASGNLSAFQALVYIHDGSTTHTIPVAYGPSSTDTLHTTDWVRQKPAEVEDVTNELITFTYQLPRKTDQIQAPAAVLMNMEGVVCNLDPVLMDWLSYIPNNKVVKSKQPKIELDLALAKAASPLQGDISQMSQISSGSKRASLTLTHSPTTEQQSTQRTKQSDTKETDKHQDRLGDRLAAIFPLIRIVQVQIELKKIVVFLPKDRLTLPEPSVNIIKNYVSLADTRSLCDVAVVCFPHVVVQSAGLKMVPYLQEIPITSMDGSLVGDKIPWSVTLRNGSMYTIHNAGPEPVRLLTLVKPATVNCTVGVSYKYTPPTSDNISALGLCLHTDMHPLEVSTHLEQIKLLFFITTQCFKIANQVVHVMKDISNSFVNKDAKVDKPVLQPPATLNPQGQGLSQALSTTSITEDQPYTHTSGDLTSLDTDPSRDLEIMENESEGVKLSLWLQWTFPKCEVNLFTKGKEDMKLCLLLEDMTMSVDVQDVYSKVKVNLGAISAKHYFLGSDNKWHKGLYEGILFTFREELSRDTHIVSSKLWSSDQHRPTTGQMGRSLYQPNQARDLAHGCMSITFTRALRKNVKKKFQKLNIEVPIIDEQNGNIVNKFYFHKYVSEICVSMNPCDVVLCTSPLVSVMTEFLAYDASKPTKTGPRNPTKVPKGDKPSVPIITCSNHPLIYADFSALRMFVPRKNVLQITRKKNELCSTLNHDMILIQTHTVSITPHAENPLPRYAVDKDLYQQAVQLGITSESGSAMQDRQYQIEVKGFSITTGSWSEFPKPDTLWKSSFLDTFNMDIVQCSSWSEFPKPDTLSKSSSLTPTTQIPAVEWNTVKSLMNEDKDIQLIPLLSPSDLKLVAAPAIVNTTPGWGNKMEEKLVCGYSFEFNVVSDLDLHCSTNQIELLQTVTMEMTDSLREMYGPSDNIVEDKDSVPDSGLGSDVSMATEKVQKVKVIDDCNDKSSEKFKLTVPLDVLLTAGRISCTVYTHFINEKEIKIERKSHENHHKAKRSGKIDLEWRVDADANNMQEDSNEMRARSTHLDMQETYFMNMYDLQTQDHEVKVIPAGSLCVKPYLFLYISQPHTVLSCHDGEQKFETSCYDILAKGPQEGAVIQGTEVKLLPDCSDFASYFMETRAGKPDAVTGVPPSLYTLTVTNFIEQPADINLKLERPVRSSLSFVKLTQCEELLEALLPRIHKYTESSSQLTGQTSKKVKAGKDTTSFLKMVNSFAVQTEQIVVSMETKPCEESPGIQLSISNVNCAGDIHLNTNGDVSSVTCNSYLRDILVKMFYNQRQLPLAGPLSVKVDGSQSAFFLDWKFQMSQSIVTIATGMVPFQVGQEHVLCMKLISEHFIELAKEWSKKSGHSSKPAKTSGKDIPLSKPEKKSLYIVHTSTDDLRSGNFLYVMESEEMPRPGEITFCSQDKEGNSSMTWTYSMPRVLSLVCSTPIPFNMMGPNGEKTIECVLQHWEPLIQQFVDYLDVELSDNNVTEVQLPDVKTAQSQDLIVAQTWRILIRNLTRDEVISPTSLAASMKIDSCFIPELVPKHEIGCTFESIELRLSNHIHCLGKETPSKLKPFFMSSCYPASGEFAVLTLDNILCAGSYITGTQSRIQGQFNSSIQLDMLEYKTLTMQKVIAPFEMSGVAIYQMSAKPPALDIDINCEPVTVRLGQTVAHTVYSSLQAWNYVISGKTEGDEVIFGHYMICNDSQVPIRFGQVGTDENLILQPREMHQYGWRSHKLKQELHLCLDGRVWKWCEPFEIGKVGSFVRGVKSTDHQYTVIIRVTKLSNVQNQIVISGQFAVSNRLSQHLEVKVVTNSSDQEHRAVVGSEHTIPSYVLEPVDIQAIKFRPWGSRGVWSKEVYVSGHSARENNLVKVTLSDQKSSFHIWCRIFTQKVDDVPQIFVVLCPLYTVRSHLPYTMYINIDTSKLDLHQQIEAPGRGHDLQLLCTGGDLHHALTFQLSPTAGKSSSSVTLSTGLIDQLSRSPVKEVNFDTLQTYWKKENWFTWPYNADVKLDDNTQKPDRQSTTHQELRLASQPTIDLNVSLSELWPGCPTLLVDITPPCLVTNLSSLHLVIMGTEDISYDIPSGQTLSPPKLEGSFHVGLRVNDETFMSAPIPVSEEELTAQRYRNDVGKTLYVDSNVTVPVFLNHNGSAKVCFLTVTLNVKHQMQVIAIRERINISNFTKHNLTVCPFVVPQLSGKIESPVQENITIPSHRGCHGDTSDLHPMTSLPLKFTDDLQGQIDSQSAFIYYLTIQNITKEIETLDQEKEKETIESTSSEEQQKIHSDWSRTVRLSANESGCKVTSCIRVTDSAGCTECVPLCITGQEKNGVMYFVIDVDNAPSCYITNRCQFPLYFGQTLMNLSLSGTTVQEQTELVSELPMLQPEESTYYTPPYLSTVFPQIHDKHTIPKLHISTFPAHCDSSSDLDNSQQRQSGTYPLSSLVWSQPIDLLMAADHFVTITGVTDVKVHVSQVAMVTCVSVEPITKADVSAKEIRSRLKGKDTTIVFGNKAQGDTSHKSEEKMEEKHHETLHDVNKPDSLTVINETKHEAESTNALQMSFGLLVNKFSFIIQDEFSKPSQWGELIRLTVDDLFMAVYPVSSHEDKTGYHRNCVVFSAGDVQLDNQNHLAGKYDFPVVIMRQNKDMNPYNSDVLPLSQMNILEKHAVLKSFSVVHLQVILGTVHKTRTVIESVELCSKPLSFYIDDTFIFRCIKEVEGFLPVPLSHTKLVPVSLLKLPSSVKSSSRTLSCPVLIGYLCLQPLDVLLSVHASLKLFIASDHTPLSFSKFEKRVLCTSGYHLTRAVVMHYASGALFRAGAVVGSLEILGNPTGLVRSIGTGVADFFRMPYRGLTRGPGAFVVGVSHGTSSMVKNITTGMLKSVTNFASSVSRNMDRLSLDGTHQERQEESRRHRPDGVGDGLIQGLTGLGISLLGAIAGLADQPIQSLVQTDRGTQSKTASLMTGMGKGLVGVFTKPIGGAAEFVSQTGQGILHGTGLSQYAKPRTDPDILDISNSTCGQLKYALKLLPSLPSTDILCCMDADFIDLTDTLVPVTLILTPEILFLINHDEDSQQQSFSVVELECGVTVADRPILNIVQRDSHTFHDQEYGPTNEERVSAFIDGASKFVPQQISDNVDRSFYIEPVMSRQTSQLEPLSREQMLERNTNDMVNMSDASSQKSPPVMDQSSHGRHAGSVNKGEQLSDTQSDSSSPVIQPNFATLPQYDFYMSATKLAAFLALFNITKHKLENVGFAI